MIRAKKLEKKSVSGREIPSLEINADVNKMIEATGQNLFERGKYKP